MSEYAVFVTWRGSPRRSVHSVGDSERVEYSETTGNTAGVGNDEATNTAGVGNEDGGQGAEGVAGVTGVGGVAGIAGVELSSPDCEPVDLAEALDGSGVEVTEQYYPDATHDVVAMVSAPDSGTVRQTLANHVDREVQQLDVLRTFSHREIDDVFGSS